MRHGFWAAMMLGWLTWSGGAPAPAWCGSPSPAAGVAASAGWGGQRSLGTPAIAGRPAPWLGVRDWLGRPPHDPHPRAWRRQKNPQVALISSLLVPGLGQLYNEREFWAVVAAGVHIYFVGDILIEARLTNRYRTLKNANPDDVEARVRFLLHRDNRVQSSWLLGLTMLLSGLQAFVDAHLFDFQADALPRFEPSVAGVRGGVLRWRF